MEKSDMPLTFKMALAHNKSSLNAFLKMTDEKQNDVINEAKKLSTIREMNNFVNSIPKTH
jgi:hypothetical protein